jgi:hypothetical protein
MDEGYKGKDLRKLDDEEEHIYEIPIIIQIFSLTFFIIKSIKTNYKCTFGLMKSKGTGVMQKANAKSA